MNKRVVRVLGLICLFTLIPAAYLGVEARGYNAGWQKGFESAKVVFEPEVVRPEVSEVSEDPEVFETSGVSETFRPESKEITTQVDPKIDWSEVLECAPVGFRYNEFYGDLAELDRYLIDAGTDPASFDYENHRLSGIADMYWLESWYEYIPGFAPTEDVYGGSIFKTVEFTRWEDLDVRPYLIHTVYNRNGSIARGTSDGVETTNSIICKPDYLIGSLQWSSDLGFLTTNVITTTSDIWGYVDFFFKGRELSTEEIRHVYVDYPDVTFWMGTGFIGGGHSSANYSGTDYGDGVRLAWSSYPWESSKHIVDLPMDTEVVVHSCLFSRDVFISCTGQRFFLTNDWMGMHMVEVSDLVEERALLPALAKEMWIKSRPPIQMEPHNPGLQK